MAERNLGFYVAYPYPYPYARSEVEDLAQPAGQLTIDLEYRGVEEGGADGLILPRHDR